MWSKARSPQWVNLPTFTAVSIKTGWKFQTITCWGITLVVEIINWLIVVGFWRWVMVFLTWLVWPHCKTQLCTCIMFFLDAFSTWVDVTNVFFVFFITANCNHLLRWRLRDIKLSLLKHRTDWWRASDSS